MSIKSLPEDVIDKIRSSSTLTSLNAAVSGLVKNALDASASKIIVRVDYSRGNCTVEDNGLGIAPEEFTARGGLGKPHSTSRLPISPDYHGKQGDFLFSVAALSLLIITSRHCQTKAHSSLSLHHGKRLVQEPADRQQKFTAFDHGTRVDIRDLFGSMPVRVKHRAILFAERADLDKEFKELIRKVTALLVAWPLSVSVSLLEVKTEKEVRLRAPEDSDHASRVSRLYTQAGLAESSEHDFWVPTSASSGPVSIEGCISTIPVASRKAQIISLGIQPLQEDYGAGILFEEINKIFNASCFALDYEHDTEQISPSKGAKWRARKAVEKWPMFYLRLELRDSEPFYGDDCLSRAGSLSAVIDLIRAVCYGFLKRYDLRPRKVRLQSSSAITTANESRNTSGRNSRQGSQSPSRPLSGQLNELTCRVENPFDNWNRAKVGRRTMTSDSMNCTELSSRVTVNLPSQGRLIGDGGKVLRRPFEEVPTPTEMHDADDSTHQVTGLDLTEQPSENSTAGWLQDILQSWQNPIFEPTEMPLAQLHSEGGLGTQESHERVLGASKTGLSTRISRASLARAEVIAQVDNKFILIKLPLDDASEAKRPAKYPRALFMVDQHAADERCRLEELMSDYFVQEGNLWRAAVETLEEPITFEVPTKESEILEQLKRHFTAWAVVYHITRPSRSSAASGTSMVAVTALPPSILERCRGEPRLLIDLLRQEAWKFDDRSQSTRYSTQLKSLTKPSFHTCPRGVLAMLHSRSCRSAIMFNDVLAAAECRSLISRLSRCSFPFQCAHGRPSMMPLVDLGRATMSIDAQNASLRQLRRGERGERLVMDSVTAWKRWLG